MNLQARPSQEELEYFAGLIKPHQSLYNTAALDQRPEPGGYESSMSANQLVEKLDYHGITMLALQNESLEDEVLQLLAGRQALMIANEALKQRALVELFEALDSAGLRCLLFKGTALAYSVYAQPWLRPRTDSDCFISHNDLPAFEQVFSNLGYEKLFALEGEYISYQSTFGKSLAGNAAINIDVHWRINNRQVLARAFTVMELIQRGQVLDSLSPSITIPSPVDSLLISALHRLGHHPHEERLTWLHDIHCLTTSLQETHWQQLLEQCGQKQLAAITLDALKISATLFNTAVPPQTLRKLEQLSQTEEPSKFYLQRNLPEWKYLLYDIKSMPNWRSRCRLILEHLFPDANYMRQQMQTSNLGIAHLKRFWRGIKRLSKSQPE